MPLVVDVAAINPRDHHGYYYTHFMSMLNTHLSPRSYMEIGTHTGVSAKLFSCDVLCIDPQFEISTNILEDKKKRAFFFQMTSDDFFAQEKVRTYFPNGPDIAFLDGMHRCEYLLRDFINTEKACHPRSLILMHDCLTLNARMADRVARFGDESEGAHKGSWTGDVWRVLFALKKYRPDLRVCYFDCPPAGLVAVSQLDASNSTLDDNYGEAVEYMMNLDFDQHFEALWAMYPTYSSAHVENEPSLVTTLINCR